MRLGEPGGAAVGWKEVRDLTAPERAAAGVDLVREYSNVEGAAVIYYRDGEEIDPDLVVPVLLRAVTCRRPGRVNGPTSPPTTTPRRCRRVRWSQLSATCSSRRSALDRGASAPTEACSPKDRRGPGHESNPVARDWNQREQPQ
jgi:hypothetical protein